MWAELVGDLSIRVHVPPSANKFFGNCRKKIVAAGVHDVDLYEEQLSRWSKLELAPAQRREVNRLSARIPTIRALIAEILTLAKELKRGTIETILHKSDYELGLDVLLGKRRP